MGFALAEAASDVPFERRIDAARDGDEDAMREVIERYQGRVARFVVSLIGRDDDYEDLCQTAFVKMVLSLPGLRSVELFEAWLFRIVRNVCMDHLRRRRIRQLFVPFTRDHESIAVEHEGPVEDEIMVFERALRKLPPAQRELIGLLRDKDWSYEELARITRSSVSSVRARLFRARSHLRELVKQPQTD